MLSSPFIHAKRSTPWVMQQVIIALIPGIAALCYFYGWAIITNLVITSSAAIAFEMLALKMRSRPLRIVKDNSALVTAVLLALSLPPGSPWWLLVLGAGLAILLAKQLYGGLGLNPFNPAMVAYVVLLISYPLEMSQWLDPFLATPSLGQTFGWVFATDSIDGYTAATALDVIRHDNGLTLKQLQETEPSLSAFAPQTLISLCYLAGGLYLLARRIIYWQMPVALILSLAVATLFLYDGSSNSSASITGQMMIGAVMLGAFFIITDPVSAPTTTKGRLVAGALAGVTIVLIRHYGNYPDAVAFAILIVNLCAPLIDYFTLPRTYGHSERKHATHTSRGDR